jgi:hypothetical protein
MEYTIKFTEQELNIILAALGELPAKNTIDLIMKIKDEALLQMSQAPEAVEEDDAADLQSS